MTNSKVIQTEVIIQKGASILVQLIAATELSETKLVNAAYKGAIWHKKPRSKKLKRIRNIGHRSSIGLGHTLYINYNPDVLSEKPLIPQLISDQVNYSIWYKPKGMWSQGSKWGDHCTITEAVKKIHNKKSLLVHRLDKASSGLMAIAHTQEAAKRLSALFTERKVEKIYHAKVQGRFTLATPHTFDQALDNKPAVTIVEQTEYQADTDTSELRLNIHTGRKHQIRQHLSQAGFPLVGDRLYGDANSKDPDLQLEAVRLSFVCPFTDIPQDFVWTPHES